MKQYAGLTLEEGSESYADEADACIMSFAIKSDPDYIYAEGKIYIEKTEQSDDSSIYSITMTQAPAWLQLAVNSESDALNGFVLSEK